MNTSTYPGYKEGSAVYRRRSVATTAPSRCCTVRLGVYGGTLFDSAMLRSSAALYDPDSGRPVVTVERPVGGTHGVC